MDIKFYCIQVLINDDYVSLNHLEPLIAEEYVSTEETHFQSMETTLDEGMRFAHLYFRTGDPRPWNPNLVDLKTKETIENLRNKDQFEPKLFFGIFDLHSSQVWIPHNAKSVFKEAMLSKHNNASFKEVIDEEEFFKSIQFLNEIKFGIVPDQIFNSINDVSQALTNDANCYGSSYAELSMSFNKQHTIPEKVVQLFKRVMDDKASFKKIVISGRNRDGLDMLFNTATVSTKVTISAKTDENGMIDTSSLFESLKRFIRNEI